MRNKCLIFFALALLLTGCQREEIVRGSSELTISLPATRTSLGEKVGVTYPVYWSEGDKISANGVESSEALIDENNPSRAQFSFPSVVNYPLNILYPSGSKVTFAAEQSYVEGTFAEGSAPMCGYVASADEAITMRHLAGVLRFAVRADKGVLLDKIVITSERSIAGEFDVDCKSGTLTQTADVGNVVTYDLPDNFELSTSESIFNIALPAVATGACKVEFVEASGEKMVMAWGGATLKAGVVREFKSVTYQSGLTMELPSLGEEEDELDIDTIITGYVRDSSGKGLEGVAVSDGFSVVESGANGYYSMIVSPDAWYIFISLPSEYEVPINEYGQPCFYQRYSPEKRDYDFTLKPLAGGKESKFALFVLTDLHISTSYRQARFEREALPSILKHASEVKQTIPCYGVALGDLIDNSNSKNTSSERLNVRALLANNRFGFPLFNTMGNHDNTYYDASNPAQSDATSSTFNLKAQRDYEDIFGPVNYSFNRGDAHIVVMRNIIYSTNTTSNNYEVGFTDAQWEWLKQDLALVPKDKMVVLGTHIKMHNESKNHIAEATALLGEYKEAHIFTGHSHIQRNYPTSGSTKKVFEHNLGAICGASWFCKMGEDGTPNGYNVFIGEGATFSDWYRMAYNKRLDSRSHQMRLYRGNAVTGGPIEGSNSYGVKGYYGFNFADDVLLANVYNADSKWKIKVYEDDVYSGDMTKVTEYQPSFSALIGDRTIDNPRRADNGVVTSVDFYATGLHLGILNRASSATKPGNGAYNVCWHMFQYKLKNKNAKIKVVATDRFGNKYTETKITEGTDYSLAKKPQ